MITDNQGKGTSECVHKDIRYTKDNIANKCHWEEMYKGWSNTLADRRVTQSDCVPHSTDFSGKRAS